MKLKDKLYLFLDVETTGLNFSKYGEFNENKLLEVAYILTNSDKELTPILEGNYLVKRNSKEIKPLMDEYVLNLHTQNGLLPAIETGKGLELKELDELITNQIKDVLQENKHKILIAGNTVHFDKEILRRELPKLYSLLHFRNLDVSSVREFIENYNGPQAIEKAVDKDFEHRALNDIRETIQEMKHYQKLLK